MSKDVKLIRGQVRQIIKEVLPEVLTQELTQAILKDVMARLELSEKLIKSTLEEMNNRSKDVMSYVVRQSAVTQPLSLPEESKKN